MLVPGAAAGALWRRRGRSRAQGQGQAQGQVEQWGLVLVLEQGSPRKCCGTATLRMSLWSRGRA